MKRTILMILVIVVIYSLIGCSSSQPTKSSPIPDITSFTFQEIEFNGIINAYNRQTTEHGYKVQVPLGNVSWGNQNQPYFEYMNLSGSYAFYLRANIGNGISFDDRFFEQKNNLDDLLRQIAVTDRPYVIYYLPREAVKVSTTYGAFLVRIENLPPLDQLDALEAKKIADKEAEEEAYRQFLSKFTIVPSNFKHNDYTSIDLFRAVSNVEQMSRVNAPDRQTAISMARNGNRAAGGLYGIAFYASDVVFVSQNGTDILFRTDDNAISQMMKVNDRAGLVAGQKVRIYYIAYKNPLSEFEIIAIEQQ